MKRTPSLFPTAYFDIKELPQVVTQIGDKRGILPSRAVPGTPKTIDTPIRLALHNNVALKLLQCLQTNLQRMHTDHRIPSDDLRRWLAGCRPYREIFRAASQRAPAPAGPETSDTEPFQPIE